MKAEEKLKLGILAGSGRLPALLASACKTTGRKYCILGFEHSFDPDLVEENNYKIVRMGAVGEAINYLRAEGVEELVMAGKVPRPTLSDLRPDLLATKLLAKMGPRFFQGDDAVLKSVIRFLEDEGFRVIGADAVLAELVTREGIIGKVQPDHAAYQDIAIGLQAAKQLGMHDIGQAVVVEAGQVLGFEAAAGTDELIERCSKLKKFEKKAILVKAKKPQQEMRADLPAIGVNTVEKIAEAGFAGIALETGGSLILEQELVKQAADEHHIFVIGVCHV